MNGMLLSAIIENISTRADGTIKVVLGCQEMSAARGGELMTMNRKLAAVYLSPKESISQKEIDQVEAIDPMIPAKSPSQRMRNVLYILWSQSPEGFKDFDSFYKYKMESYIDAIKQNLNS